MDEWETLNAIGVQLYASREFKLAYEAFLKASAADSSQPIVYYNLGMTSRVLGQEEEARSLLETYERICREACPYFNGRKRGGMDAFPCALVQLGDFDGMLERGFRRTGDTISRNVCPDCRDCVQLRVPLAEFRPDSGQRRVLSKNRLTRFEADSPPLPTAEKAALMGRYMGVRHGWPEQDYATELASYYAGWRKSFELCYWYGDRLGMVAIFDSGEMDLYASACFFDPEFSSLSPGVFNILTAIRWGAQSGYRYLYLGERIESKSNMRYKSAFRPHHLLADGGWVGG